MRVATHWALLTELTAAQMKARYRRTFAGFLWVVFNPIVMYSVQALVFKHILKINISNYTLFLLGGLLPWTFIVSSLDMGIPVLQFSRELLVAFKIHPFILVTTSVLDNSFNFLAAFVFLLLPVAFLSDISPLGLLFLPLAVLQMVIGIWALTWFLSVFNVFFRDTRFVIHFVISILFFLTPIFYPIDFISYRYRWLVGLNPLYLLLEPVRRCIYNFSPSAFSVSFIKGLLVSSLMVFCANIYWKRRRNEFYFYL